ncbi:GNAT family N-acetyltransferase [Kumtagia ephedrae]|uniref:GNAT family N-acetyltransferase n=1 Tax=Kumtagia ephedrae TaxID=2116701 RepID=A0A2P7STB6_9HYPH|nr:GNAT family N-acetyltransferase [Mesorhizobium ephedrae]PSJ65714.1 GNAT family N-acetyltransferase [Mesorhizobium ephedrae]
MVDAALGATGPAGAALTASRPTIPAVRISAEAVSAETMATLAALAHTGIFAPPQSPAWTGAWIAAVAPDTLAVIVAEGDRPVFALVLEVVGKGPCRVARFPGGTHANGNFALADASWLATAQPRVFRDLAAAVRSARPDIDLLALERLLPELGGLRNPLLALPHFKSANLSLAVGLDGGFARLVAGRSGKHKRKKHRSQARKYEAAGGFRRIEAETEEQVDRLLQAFFAMKACRFRKAGIVDVFADPSVQAFFRKLFHEALPLSPKPFVLHALEVGGVPRAVTGSSRCGDRLICEFGAIADDEVAQASPGEFLFFENIREACEEGLAVYDFSVGDEQYKRLWCDIETQHLDVLVPLTLKGRLVAGMMRLFAGMKARVKNSPTVWRLTKALRRRAVGNKADAGPAEE